MALSSRGNIISTPSLMRNMFIQCQAELPRASPQGDPISDSRRWEQQAHARHPQCRPTLWICWESLPDTMSITWHIIKLSKYLDKPTVVPSTYCVSSKVTDTLRYKTCPTSGPSILETYVTCLCMPERPMAVIITEFGIAALCEWVEDTPKLKLRVGGSGDMDVTWSVVCLVRSVAFCCCRALLDESLDANAVYKMILRCQTWQFKSATAKWTECKFLWLPLTPRPHYS